MSYQNYVQDTLSLLNDQALVFTPLAQLTRWINNARSDIAKQTGCIQRLLTGQSALGSSAQPGYIIPGAMQPGALPNAIPAALNSVANLSASQNNLATIPGVERYPYQGFWNPLLQAQYAGVKGVLSVCNLSNAWGSAFRPTLTWLPWDAFQAYCRAYANQTTSYPCVWAVLNDGEAGEIWLFPCPSQVNELEALVACVPNPIHSDDDYDAIPDEMKELVKYKAAEMVFMSAQRYGQAEMMRGLYNDQMLKNVVARDPGHVRSYYASGF